MIEIHPLAAIGEVLPGTNLVDILGDALAEVGCTKLGRHDAIVVTQKIVSKAEDSFVDLAGVTPGAEMRFSTLPVCHGACGWQ